MLDTPDLRQKIADQGAVAAVSDSPQEFATYVAAENVLWAKIVRGVMGAPSALVR